MHTSEYQDPHTGELKALLHHNGDFSGDVSICLYRSGDSDPYLEASIPFAIMEWIVAEKVRNDAIAFLEEADPGSLLVLFDDPDPDPDPFMTAVAKRMLGSVE